MRFLITAGVESLGSLIETEISNFGMLLPLPVPLSPPVTGSFCILAPLGREITEWFSCCGERHQAGADKQEAKLFCDLKEGSALFLALAEDLADADLLRIPAGITFHCPLIGLKW